VEPADSFIGEFVEAGWLRLEWCIGHELRLRAASRLGANWPEARPWLRVVDSSPSDVAENGDRVIYEMPLAGDSSRWFVPIPRNIRTVRGLVGYRTRDGRFHSLLASPVLHSRRNPIELLTGPISLDPQDGAMTSPRTRRRARRKPLFPSVSIDVPQPSVYRTAGNVLASLAIRTELRVSGRAAPGSRVTCDDQSVTVDATGIFNLSLPQPEGRQVLALTIQSRDGRSTQRLVLAFERNTKVLETEVLESDVENGDDGL
jgi:hypothetical protein